VPGPPTTADVDRALAFQAATTAGCADTVVDLPFGRVLTTPSLPFIYSLNTVEVRGAGATPDAIRAAMPDVPRPSVFVVDEASQEALRPMVDGWSLDDELTMVLGDAPEPPPRGRVREAAPEEIAALDRLWMEDEFGHEGPDVVEQMLTLLQRQLSVRGTRAFCSPDCDAMTLLWHEGDTAQLEDVYTRPEARNRGHARALVSHAAALARAEGFTTIFLVADAVATPRQLYEKLGFVGAHRALRFTQPVS
jgi:GNAT superfamily N-acetyltransferase